MSYVDIPARTTGDFNAAADVNQLQENLRVLSGNGSMAPDVGAQVLDGMIDLPVSLTIDNLIIQPNSTNPTYQVDISFAGLMVEDRYLINGSGTLDITTGLDTGSEAVSTWYYIWIFTKTGEATYTFRFSTSNTGPTVPEGYTKKWLIGVVRNDASGDFLAFYQKNKTVITTPVYIANIEYIYPYRNITSYIPHLITDICFGYAATNDSSYTSIGPYTGGMLGHIFLNKLYYCMYYELPVHNNLIYTTSTSNAIVATTGYILNI